MAQDDYVVPNGSGSDVRAKIDTAFLAIASNNSGGSAPSTAYAYEWWSDTTNGLLKQRNAANTAWLVRGTLAESFLVSRSSNTILGVADYGKTILATSTFTQTLTAAATLGDGWHCTYSNVGAGIITIDPNGSETIDGAASIGLAPGQSLEIKCDGSNFRTFGNTTVRARVATLITATGTWTRTPGSLGALVGLKAGGGSGGSSTSAGCGGSGGEGEMTWGYFDAATLGASQSVTIGAGGSAIGANQNSNGNTGSASSFGALMTAAPGVGGTKGHAGGNPGPGGVGGTGYTWREPGDAGQAGADNTGASIGILASGGGKGGGAFGANAATNSGAGGGGGSVGANSGGGAAGYAIVIEDF